MVSHFIAFFGPDGSGKSTHAELLIQEYRARNKKVKKIWIRSPHTLAFLMSKVLMRIGLYRENLNPYGRRSSVLWLGRNKTLRVFWCFSEIISVLLLVLIRVYIPLSLGYIVIAERYLIDTIVTIAYVLDDFNFLYSGFSNFLLRFIPKGAIFIYLDSSYKILLKRRGCLVEPYNFIKFQKKGYDALNSKVNGIIIDTSNTTVKQTHSRIMNLICYRLGIYDKTNQAQAN